MSAVSGSIPYSFSAPAKVNLALRVVGRQADGFHLLWTVMTFFELYDTLAITYPAADLSVTCDPPVTAVPEENLVYRAAQRLRQESGTRQGALLHLTKRIPHGAGLGGGSSDAATALLALNELWQLHWPLSRLLQVGVQLGADIPIFLGGHAALAEGVGERLTSLPHLATAELVVVSPGVVLPTGRVFQEYDRWHQLADRDCVSCSLAANHATTVLSLLCNDLQATAVQMAPVIGDVAQRLLAVGAQAVLMSGSGSALFGLFADSQRAMAAARELTRTNPQWGIYTGRTFNQHPFANEWKSAIKGSE